MAYKPDTIEGTRRVLPVLRALLLEPKRPLTRVCRLHGCEEREVEAWLIWWLPITQPYIDRAAFDRALSRLGLDEAGRAVAEPLRVPAASTAVLVARNQRVAILAPKRRTKVKVARSRVTVAGTAADRRQHNGRTPVKALAVLRLIAQGVRTAKACREVGSALPAFCRWRRRNELAGPITIERATLWLAAYDARFRAKSTHQQ